MKYVDFSRCIWGFLSIFLVLTCCEFSGSIQSEELSAEETQQVQAAERFLKVLEKAPRRGTALDRVYGHHVEFGTLDKFVEQLNDRVTKESKDHEAWMLLGLFESQRGADAVAVDAFQQAAKLRASDPLASYYLGQSLLRIGQTVEAVAAFEQALTRKPARADLLEIFQQLGRVHQRAQRIDEAMKVWQRLETLFPDDPRVLEQIAVTMVEEGSPELALPRYERLTKLVKDDYRRTLFRVEAAGLKIKTNRRDEGIADMEAVLADLNPTSWLYRDIRRRIEEIFLKSGDQDNLVKYYQNWLTAHADDIEAMSRLAKFLASSARVPEAQEWMEKALKLAPSRTDLRKAFIDQLVDDQRIPDAIKQYPLLIAAAPSNPDFMRDWGKLVLKDKSQEMDVRRKEASKIWNQIVALRPDDASNLAQVADFFRQANLIEEATALYQKAVEKAPNDPQYREYLGEFLHIQKRTDEALKTWTSIAEGSRRNAVNVTRLAEVYNSFGYQEQAVKEIAEACRMDAKDFSLQIRGAEYHMRGNLFKEAIAFIDIAEKLAANDDERDTVVKQRMEVFQSNQQLGAEIEKLTVAIQNNASASAEQWHLLARYHDADRQWTRASEAIDTALKLDPKSIPILNTAARISEGSGDFGRAADFNRKLTTVDRRSLGDHLMNVARLEAQLGRADEALKAAQELIVSAPGNTDNYEFLAQMCFRFGKQAEGLEAIRKAVRINPNEPHLTMVLGTALADQLRTDEAIEVYWRAFDKTDDLDDKTSLTLKLVPLYQQINQFDKLIDRIERDRREEEKRREMTICLAQAHNAAGDYGTARQELESLLSQDTRDTNLLQQIAKLCEGGQDLEAAIGYQKQLVSIAPGAETELPLAKMLQARGDRDEAAEILVKITQREEDPIRLLKSIDSLLMNSNMEAVLRITEPLLSQQRDDWELIYREGVAWALLNKPDEAKDRFQRILTLKFQHDALGVSGEAKLKQAQAKAKSDNLRGITNHQPTRQSPLDMLDMSYSVQQAVGLINANYYYSGNSGPQPVWTPEAFGVARMAAYGWLLKFDEDTSDTIGPAQKGVSSKNTLSWIEHLSQNASIDSASSESIYDWLYVATLKSKYDEIFKMARKLAKSGGKESQQFFMGALSNRELEADEELEDEPSGQVAHKKTPLDEDDLQLMLKCYEDLSTVKSDNTSAATMGGQVIYAANGQVYANMGGNYVLISGVFGDNGDYLSTITAELKLAGREKQADEMMESYLAKLDGTSKISAAMNFCFEKEKYDELPKLYESWGLEAKKEIAKASATPLTRQNQNSSVAGQQLLNGVSYFLIRWMGKLGPDEEHAQILSILDPALDLAIANAKQSRAERMKQINKKATSSPSQNYQGGNYFQLFYGKEEVQSNIDFPDPNEYVDNSTLMLMREVYEVFNRNDVIGDLPAHLRLRLANAKEDDQLYERLLLATALWWSDEQDEAVELMANAAELLKEDVNFRFEMAAMREKRGEFDEALEIVEAIVPRDQPLLQKKELMALQLAERLGDNERAYVATERLFGLRLDTDTQLGLAQGMRRLGLHEMADAVVSRIERQAGSQTNSLTSLMMMYQGQNKTSEANQIAHMLLHKTNSTMSQSANSSRNPYRYQSSGNDTRNQALQVLQQSGELKKLVEKTETQLARSPESLKLYEQLIEYYTILGDQAKATDYLKKAVAQKPDSVAFRYQLAKQLESTGKAKEACDQYLEVIKQKPEWVTEDLYSIRNVFQKAKRTLDLVEAIQSINVKKIQQPYYITEIVSNLMQEEKNSDIAIDLFEKVFEAFPSYRSNMIANFHDAKIWTNDRIYQLGKRAMIPSSADIVRNPWFGVNEIRSYADDGTVTSKFQEIVNALGKSDKLADLQQSIEDGVKENPKWLGGKAMLALLDLKANRKALGLKALQAVVDNATVMKAIPSEACWIIGQELDKAEQSRPMALALFERAISGNEDRGMNPLQYTPISRLIKLYSDLGRKEEGRDLLLKALRTKSGQNYDAQYAAYQKLENSFWASSKLLEMGFPVDSIRLLRVIMDDDEGSKAASRFNGRPADYYVNQSKKNIEKALATLDASNADEAVARLLQVSEKQPSGVAALDLMLSAPAIENIQNKKLESGLINLFESFSKLTASSKADNLKGKKEKAKSGKEVAREASHQLIGQTIDDQLTNLSTKYPTDLSIPIALATTRLRNRHALAGETVKSLTAILDEQPLDVIAEGRRPNSRQRKEAALSVPLWMVASECLKTKEFHTEGKKLADRALIAARRQTGNQYSMAVLFDWAKLLLNQGDRVNAEVKLVELLKIATERPQRKQASELSEPSMIPPLTLSQFKLTIAIASMAADSGMSSLSRKAIQDALVGGVPVPDASEGLDPTSNPFGATVVRSSRNADAVDDSNAIETTVAKLMKSVIVKWKGDPYPAIDVYGLLKPLVLPPSRPTEILMYADSSKLRDAQLSSLAEYLVKWAKQANKLTELEADTVSRMKSPTSKVAGTVMQVLIAIVNEQFDRSNSLLSELVDQSSKGMSPVMLQLACHAALPATSIPANREQAFNLLKKALEQQIQAAASDRNNEPDTVGKLAEKVNRYMADNGDTESVKKYFDSLLASRQRIYSRYSGDYGIYKQALDTALFAGEAARVSMPSVALDFMGRASDFQFKQYSKVSVKLPLTIGARQLRTMPPAERYEAWHAWTMPTKDRQSIRLAMEFVSPSVAPEAFLKIQPVLGSPFDTDLICNWSELILAARESQNLERLKADTQQALQQKIANADYLLALIFIEQADLLLCEPLFQKIVSSLPERKKSPATNDSPDYRADYVLYNASRRSAQFTASYNKALGKTLATTEALRIPNYQPHIVFDYAMRTIADNQATLLPGDDARLKHWFAASTLAEPTSSIRPWWVVHEGHLAHLTGSGTDLCYFKYPLQGDFEFSVNIYHDGNSNGEVGFGGSVYQTQQSNVLSLSGRETVYQNNSVQRAMETYNRVQIRSSDNEQHVFVNGQEVYSEPNTETSPWLTLLTLQTSMTTFRDLEFKGSPIIPREVPLLIRDSMDGWNCSFFNETRPRKRLMAVKASSQNEPNYYEQQRETSDFDWIAKDGVLNGKGKSELQEPGQSWIYYHRPLQTDESFRYEFYYKNGESVAHPSIGRVAILLEPDGIQEHWIAQANWDDIVTGIPLNNAVVSKECRKGPAVLPLKDNEWNTVELTFKNNLAIVSLNGVVVYERPQPPLLDTRFGVFRYKNQTTKVRQATLTGPWPTQLSAEILKNLLAVSAERSPTEKRIIHSILTDRIFKADVPEVVAKARPLEAKKAFDLLKRWVLPSDEHGNFRLYYCFAPITPNEATLNSTRADTMLCPAIDLVARAVELKQLPELQKEIQAISTNGKLDERNQNALLTMIAMEQGDERATRKGFADFFPLNAQNIPNDLAIRDRAAEYVVAWKASEHHAYVNQANDIVNAFFLLERNKESNSNNPDWKMQLGILSGKIAKIGYRPTHEPSNGQAMLTQWHRIPYLKPETRHNGYRPSEWLYEHGTLQHLTGGTWQQLYFQSPLRGKFEIVSEHSMYKNRDMAFAYGMHSVELIKARPAIAISKVMHNSVEVDKKLDISNLGDVSKFRVVVDGNKITTWINGVQVHQEIFDTSPDPWVVLQAKQPQFASLIRDIRILGTPEIPKEIELIDMAGWAGWRADVFNESHSGNGDTPAKGAKGKAKATSNPQNKNAAWQHVGEEIVGSLRKNAGKNPIESLLMYQRPVLEDGELEWDAFYTSGEVEVHPSIGRIVFIIRSDGVRLHRLTEGLYESSGIAADNESPIEGAANEVDLKEKSWNHFKLAIAGDELRLSVNHKEVAQYPLFESPTERHFGLFHYSNKTKSRVRKLVYRGEWPKTLPSVKDQQLAYPLGGPHPLESSSGFETTRLPFKQSLEALQKAGFTVQGPTDQYSVTQTGLKIALKNVQDQNDQRVLKLPISLDHDCEITLDYRDLVLKAAKQGYGVTFGLAANLKDADRTVVECSQKIGAEKQPVLNAAVRRKSPIGAHYVPESLQLDWSPPAGRLRLVRKSGVIHCLYAETGSDEFRLVHSYAVGSAPIDSLTIEAKSSDDIGQIDVTLEQLTIRTPRK